MKKGDPYIDKKIEDAILYLTNAYVKTGHNPKPVVLHSIRVGFYLFDHGYELDIVIAGVLHDIIEDTEVTYNQIQNIFGDRVASLVNAVSFNEKIEDEHEQFKDSYNRCNEVGKDAFVILAADFISNLPYYHLSKKEVFDYLIDKLEYYLIISKECIKDEAIYKELQGELNDFIKKRKKLE